MVNVDDVRVLLDQATVLIERVLKVIVLIRDVLNVVHKVKDNNTTIINDNRLEHGIGKAFGKTFVRAN